MKAFAALFGLVTLSCVGAAGALTPPLPDCSGALLAPQEAAMGDYNPLTYSGGMVLYQRYIDAAQDRFELVVEHCPSRDRMAAEFLLDESFEAGWARIDVFWAQLDAAFADSQVHTFADLVNMAREAGGEGRVSRVDWESCACQLTRMRGY